MPPNVEILYVPAEEAAECTDVPDEPLVFLPSAVSTVSITDLPKEIDSSTKPTWFTRFAGVSYTLLACFLFTCTAFSLKQLGVNLLDALILRFIVQVAVTFTFVRYKGYPILFRASTRLVLLQMLCCATGGAGFFLYFIAIGYVEVSDVMTLSYTRVVWTVVFSIFLYRERPSLSTLGALPLTILGVIFVAQPTFFFSTATPSTNGQLRFLGLVSSIAGSIASATNIVTFKQLISSSKDIKPSVINLQYIIAVLISLVINQLYKQYILHTGLTLNVVVSWRYILASLACLVLIVPNILTQKAIKREHPAIFTLLTSADIIFALILQNIFTAKRSNLFALLGSTLVIGSVLIIGLSKIRKERSSRHKIKLVDDQTVVCHFENKNGKC